MKPRPLITMGNRSATLAERDALLLTLRTFLDWAAKPQPRGALLQHHGCHTKRAFFRGELQFVQATDFCGRVLFIFHRSATPPGRDYMSAGERERRTWAESRIWTETDHRRLKWMAELASGRPCLQHWGSNFASVALDLPMGRGFMQLVDTYRAGCPHRGTYFGGMPHRTGSVFCACGWFDRGYKLAKLPEGWR